MNPPIASQCHPCILNQARTAARFAELGPEATAEVLAVAQAGIDGAAREGLVVQHIVRRVADRIIELLGETPEFDIYAEVKRRSNTLALEHLDTVQQHVACADDSLAAAIQAAAAGNIIDFGARDHATLDVARELEHLTETGFAHDDIDALRAALDHAETVLYLCDNAGEIVLDTLLVDALQRGWPHLQLTAAVRDVPVINDATLADAEIAGLTMRCPVISSGSVYPGTILAETSEDFRARFAAADVIVSKGQGNFETLLPVADPRVFFLLRIKCDYMADLAGVPRDELVLLQAGAGGPGRR